MDKTEQNGQTSVIQPKKDNAFHPSKNGETVDQKELNQPQWKMGAPSKKNYQNDEEAKYYYSQYGVDGLPNGSESAMGMMTYPFDYMAWVTKLSNMAFL